MKKPSRTISGVGLGLGMTAVGFATWGVLSAGAASASMVAHTVAKPASPFPATGPATAPATAPATSPATSPATVSPTSPTMAPTAPATAPATTVPTEPPETGGGGTAGLQDAVLFGVGGAALLVGSGSIVYRLRSSKQR